MRIYFKPVKGILGDRMFDLEIKSSACAFKSANKLNLQAPNALIGAFHILLNIVN